MSLNPYQPGDDQVHAEETLPHISLDRLARRIFIAWERLRLVYNAILAITVICVATVAYVQYQPTSIPLSGFFGTIVPVVGANLCFFAGPIVETYVAWLGFRTETLRLVLMFFGTALSMMIAIAWVIALLNPQL